MSDILLHQASQSHEAGDHALAERLYKDILQREPRNVSALYQFAFLCGQGSRFAEAERLMGQAIALQPSAKAYFLRGSALLNLSRLEEAIACFDRALALKPDFPEALLNRAAALFRMKRHAEAGEDYDRLLRLDPDYPYAHGNRLFCQMHGCDWQSLPKDIAAVAAGLRDGKRVIAPFDAMALPLSEADLLRCASIWSGDQAPPAPNAMHLGKTYGHDRIRLAYIASQFGEDPVSSLITGVIEHHDRRRFEVIGVPFRAGDGSRLHTRIWAALDVRVDAAGMTDIELARRLRDMEVDIAVDLSGFTEGGRLGVFALRPAPLQVSYLGFSGAMGAPYIDYLLADRIVIPPDSRACYREAVAYLPDSYMSGDATRAIAERRPSRIEAGLPERGFVFASFNNTYKFNPPMFDIWMRLLRAVEGSVLWLPKSNPVALANLSQHAKARGVPPERLVFAPFLKEPEDHLARLSLADLFLDTLPYNAHSTAVDALWAGVPVLTVKGTTFAGRVAASLLHAAGIPELVVPSLEDYESAALKFATDPHALAAVKARLAKNRTGCALFDTARFARHLESAFATMHERAERGLPPQSFAVEARS